MTAALICPGGIAELLKCSREHVLKRIVGRPGFPPPAVDLSQKMRLWDLDDVLTHLRTKPRRAGRPRRS